MTDAIVRLFTRRRKRLPDAVFADRLELARYRVQQLGDRERDLLRWRDSYRIRTGVAA